MFKKTQTYLKKNERRIMLSALAAVGVYAAYYKLVASNSDHNFALMVNALKELDLEMTVMNKVTEQLMRDDY